MALPGIFQQSQVLIQTNIDLALDPDQNNGTWNISCGRIVTSPKDPLGIARLKFRNATNIRQVKIYLGQTELFRIPNPVRSPTITFPLEFFLAEAAPLSYWRMIFDFWGAPQSKVRIEGFPIYLQSPDYWSQMESSRMTFWMPAGRHLVIQNCYAEIQESISPQRLLSLSR